MSRGIKQEDDSSQYWDLVRRLERLESATPKRQAITVSSGASIDLGAIDGENITGVRFAGKMRLSGGSGTPVIRIGINGLTSISTQESLIGATQVGAATTYTPVATFGGGGGNGPAAGLAVAAAAYSVTCDISFQGVLYTAIGPNSQLRSYLGNYFVYDRATDPNLRLVATVGSHWIEFTTVISSLKLVVDSGVMTGRVAVETLP